MIVNDPLSAHRNIAEFRLHGMNMANMSVHDHQFSECSTQSSHYDWLYRFNQVLLFLLEAYLVASYDGCHDD